MPVFVWILRFFAVCLFALMIFPAGFNTFFGHGDTIAWSETYVYLVGLLATAYGVKIAWMQNPTRVRVAGGYLIILTMLTAFIAIGFFNVLDI